MADERINNVKRDIQEIGAQISKIQDQLKQKGGMSTKAIEKEYKKTEEELGEIEAQICQVVQELQDKFKFLPKETDLKSQASCNTEDG